jgi:hypothetical protein
MLGTSPSGGAAGVWVPAVRFLRISRLGVLGLLCLMLVLGTSAGGRANSVGGESGAPVAGNGPCPNASSPSTFSGQLVIEGGPLTASAVSQVTLSYAYFEESTVRYSPNGTLISVNCTEDSATTTTDENGGFSFSIVLPAESCEPVPPSGDACTTYSGPYVPVHVTPASPSPSGYDLAVTQNGSWFNLTWVAQLALLSLTPTGTLATLSTGAPGQFVATPEMANGTRSPLTPSFHWTLRGAGWTFVAVPTAGTATVEGARGALEGNLTVQAAASVGSTVLTTPVLQVNLEAEPTSIVNGSVNRTLLDAGGSIAVAVDAMGAVGYSYSASVAPGIGQAPTDVACSTTSASPSTVSVRCATSVTYRVEGTASLAVNVSNGYSSQVWSSPALTVDPAPALAVDPSPLTGYAGSPMSVVLTVAEGSGSPPYATACFAPEAGPTLCSRSPGPSWTFTPTFAAAGNYSAMAWAVDSTGMNRSASVAVRVLGPLEVGALLLGSRNVSAGTAVSLSSSVEGGDLPGRLWWNASDLAAPLRTESVGADGPLTVEFVPPSVGTVLLSLTLIDSLGTVAKSSVVVSVTVGPAASIVLTLAAPSTPVVVGSPIPVAWEALNAVDAAVPSFATAATLSVETSAGEPALSWLNSSAIGGLSSSPEGTFAVPSGAWVAGYLNLTVTPTVAGALTVRLTGPELPGGPLVVPLVTAPDASRLRLFDPTVVLAGSHSNRTYWRVSDRFGNPVPGAYIVVQYLSRGSSSDWLVPVELTSAGATGVWVNYSIPDPSGEVRVLDRSGDVLLGPLDLPGAEASPLGIPAATALLVAASVGTVAALTSRGMRRREPSARVPDEEEEARRLAEGRGTVLEIVRAAGVANLGSVEAAFRPEPPPPDLDDWVASLVADGTLRARSLPDGSAEFSVALERPRDLRVTVDEVALNRAVARREAAFRDGEEDPP